jgi:hypothetical protein
MSVAVAAIWAGTACGVTAMLALSGLSAWRGWLALQHEMLRGLGQAECGDPEARIEIAALKERIRRLEAIATGVDL